MPLALLLVLAHNISEGAETDALGVGGSFPNERMPACKLWLLTWALCQTKPFRIEDRVLLIFVRPTVWFIDRINKPREGFGLTFNK